MLLQNVFLCVIFATISFITSDARKLPSFIKQCKLKYPELNLCLKKAIEDVKPRLPKGIPEMHIPQLEPVHITETTLSSGDFQATFKNVVIGRASNFTVSNIDFDVEHNEVTLQVHFPVIEFASDYNVVGKVLVLQLNGSGKSHGNATELEGTTYLTGKRKLIKGKEHLLFDKVKIDLKFGGGWLYFDDLFHGNKELSVRLNEVINDNILDVLEEIKPLVEHATGEVILNLIKGVFERYAIEELFLTG